LKRLIEKRKYTMKIEVSFAPKALKFKQGPAGIWKERNVEAYINDIKFASMKFCDDGMVEVLPSHPFLSFDPNFWMTRFKTERDAVDALQKQFDKFWMSISVTETEFKR
jgi:hypothetical protein